MENKVGWVVLVCVLVFAYVYFFRPEIVGKVAEAIDPTTTTTSTTTTTTSTTTTIPKPYLSIEYHTPNWIENYSEDEYTCGDSCIDRVTPAIVFRISAKEGTINDIRANYFCEVKNLSGQILGYIDSSEGTNVIDNVMKISQSYSIGGFADNPCKPTILDNGGRRTEGYVLSMPKNACFDYYLWFNLFGPTECPNGDIVCVPEAKVRCEVYFVSKEPILKTEDKITVNFNFDFNSKNSHLI
jgi:hypothetical protein